MAIIKKEFQTEGMTCTSCEKIIERQAMKVKGVKSVKVNYKTGVGVVSFDDKKTDIDEILDKIEEKNYECKILDDSCEPSSSNKSIIGTIFAIIGFIAVIYFLLRISDMIALPSLSQNMSLGLLFIVGLITGFHCIAMCGGFVVSYTANDAKHNRKSYFSHLMYGTGKTLSYTIIGAIFGFIGSIIAFTPTMRGIAGVIAGIFLIIFGLNMLNVFKSFRWIRIKTPSFLSKFTFEQHEKHSSSPLIIGLLNGLMIACGPLQAIYIMAAGTGSAIEGAKMLFVFGLGTLPVMIGFGFIASAISSKATRTLLKVSGAIIIILGILMLNNGLALSGSGYDLKSISEKLTLSNSNSNGKTYTNTPNANNVAIQKEGYQEIRMDVTAKGWSPDKFILKKGVPVHWIINGKELTSCNNAIQVPSYKLQFKIQPGEQTINFTPTESGVIAWSCWMGMIPGTFVVVDDLNSADVAQVAAAAQPKAAGGSCGMGGGGCGCGGMMH